MRQAGTIHDQGDATRFADYLLSLGIKSRIDAAAGEWAVWIYDEDHVAQAVRELETFRGNPSDPRYLDAEQAAEAVRQQQAQKEREYRRNVIDVSRRWERLGSGGRPFTMLLMAISVAVALMTQFGEDRGSVVQNLSIASYIVDGLLIEPHDLWEVANGQVWRLLTPIFLHFGPLHLGFNMWMLFSFGGLVESRRGTWRTALLVSLLAVTSNLGQYLYSGPIFGGMSGVIYGLFGYCWMKSRFEPELGIWIPASTVVILVAWFFLCLVGVIGHIANLAHGVGLVVGIAVGYAPTAWRKLRRI